ncbi:hypothetical protein [Nocardia sp. IFM 10818]
MPVVHPPTDPVTEETTQALGAAPDPLTVDYLARRVVFSAGRAQDLAVTGVGLYDSGHCDAAREIFGQVHDYLAQFGRDLLAIDPVTFPDRDPHNTDPQAQS